MTTIVVTIQNIKEHFSSEGKYREGQAYLRVYLSRDLLHEIYFQPLDETQREWKFTFTVNQPITPGWSALCIDLFAQSESEKKIPFFQSCGSIVHSLMNDDPSHVQLKDCHIDFGDTPVSKGEIGMIKVDGRVQAVRDRFDLAPIQPILDSYFARMGKCKMISSLVDDMHCIEYVTRCQGIKLPYFAFIWNKPVNVTPTRYYERMLACALKLHNMELSDIQRIWADQVAHPSAPVPGLERMGAVCVTMLSFFTYSIPYVEDHTMNNDEMVETEDLVDCRFDRRGDCEDMARSILVNFMDFLSIPRDEGALREVFHLLREYVPVLSINGVRTYSAAYDVNANAQSPRELACHCVGFLMHSNEAGKYTEAAPRTDFTFVLPKLLIEGTAPMMCEKVSPEKLYGGTREVWEKLSMLQKSAQEALPYTTSIFSTDTRGDAFYSHVTDLFFPYHQDRLTYAVLPQNKEGLCGAKFVDWMQHPQNFSAFPVIQLNEVERETIRRALWYEAPIPSLRMPSEREMQKHEAALAATGWAPLKPVPGIDFFIPMHDLSRIQPPAGFDVSYLYVPACDGSEVYFVLRLSLPETQ